MAVMRFVVLRCEGEWKIVTSRRKVGHFQTFEAAFATGSALAQEAKAAGHDVELLVQGLAGDLSTAAPLCAAQSLETLEGLAPTEGRAADVPRRHGAVESASEVQASHPVPAELDLSPTSAG